MFQNIGEIIVFCSGARCERCRWPGVSGGKVFDQLFEIGNGSLLMVCILSLFIGGVLALQTGPVLVERGLSYVLGGNGGPVHVQGAGAGACWPS